MPPVPLSAGPTRAVTRGQIVAYAGGHAPGTIIVRTKERALYLVQGDGKAIRYRVAVGRPGAAWSGIETISDKQEWPNWTPTLDMRRRRPGLRAMRGGPNNPLGARALYLGTSTYRIHGTTDPGSIGRAASSGCIRMLNSDVIELYERVHVGTRVQVL
ncbi:L,D-transpeptidase [Methylobacterium sp. CM6247]